MFKLSSVSVLVPNATDQLISLGLSFPSATTISTFSFSFEALAQAALNHLSNQDSFAAILVLLLKVAFYAFKASTIEFCPYLAKFALNTYAGASFSDYFIFQNHLHDEFSEHF